MNLNNFINRNVLRIQHFIKKSALCLRLVTEWGSAGRVKDEFEESWDFPSTREVKIPPGAGIWTGFS
jgi:hypothetical protein